MSIRIHPDIDTNNREGAANTQLLEIFRALRDGPFSKIDRGPYPLTVKFWGLAYEELYKLLATETRRFLIDGFGEKDYIPCVVDFIYRWFQQEGKMRASRYGGDMDVIRNNERYCDEVINTALQYLLKNPPRFELIKGRRSFDPVTMARVRFGMKD